MLKLIHWYSWNGPSVNISLLFRIILVIIFWKIYACPHLILSSSRPGSSRSLRVPYTRPPRPGTESPGLQAPRWSASRCCWGTRLETSVAHTQNNEYTYTFYIYILHNFHFNSQDIFGDQNVFYEYVTSIFRIIHIFTFKSSLINFPQSLTKLCCGKK